jgi:hypothetical protein
MPSKELIHSQILIEVKNRINNLKLILGEMFDAASGNDAKSSAGDKHETVVAMSQLEQEKLTKKINELLKLQENLQKINEYDSFLMKSNEDQEFDIEILTSTYYNKYKVIENSEY